MSILPSNNHSQGSNSSSSSSPSQSSTNHGFLSPPQSQSQSQQSHHAFQSLRISDPNSNTGQGAPTRGFSGHYSKKMNVTGGQSHNKSLAHHRGGRSLHRGAAAEAGTGSAEWQRKESSNVNSPGSSHNTASTSSQSSSGHSTSRKSQVVSGNHLLNFQYDPIPIPRSRPRFVPPKREQKRKPYNRDLFLQANYKFVVLDSGNYAPGSMNPDKTLCWEDIICLKYSTPFPVQCPICLDDPLCPQITSCGHIFCFPCILQYFSMGEEDNKGECWKKCPLCFTMISSKDLYTIKIEKVKQYKIGDTIEFVLLNRLKDSFTSSLKNNEGSGNDADIQDSFSKFIMTSDVDFAVKEAMSDLDSWVAKADSGLVDDIEKLPYVCAAIKQLEQRKKLWDEHRASNGDNDLTSPYGSPTLISLDANSKPGESVRGTISTATNEKSKREEKPNVSKKGGEVIKNEPLDHDRFSPSLEDDNESIQTNSNGFKDNKERDSYNFYQVVDGQHLILHPLNMKCLLHHYGNYDRLPNRIAGNILQLETVTQSEAIRRRYRYLSHFSLTTTFQLCEIDLSEILPVESLSPFMDEIKNRAKQRKQLARKEHKDKVKAEAAASQFAPVPYYLANSLYDRSPKFSMDEFEALGSLPMPSSSPPTIGERQSFSNVAKLGFAAGYDSPALRTDESHQSSRTDVAPDLSGANGLNTAGASSFANVTSRAKPVESSNKSKENELGKKGKKPSRVLLSTAGGRRY